MNKIATGIRIAVLGAAVMLSSSVGQAETVSRPELDNQLNVERFMDALMDPCIDVNKFIDALVDPEQKTAMMEMNFVLQKCEVES